MRSPHEILYLSFQIFPTTLCSTEEEFVIVFFSTCVDEYDLKSFLNECKSRVILKLASWLCLYVNVCSV